jgi:hypothetical protein
MKSLSYQCVAAAFFRESYAAPDEPDNPNTMLEFFQENMAPN